jgi:hypothetical protein
MVEDLRVNERIMEIVSAGRGLIHSEYKTDPGSNSIVAVQANLGRMEDARNWWYGTINRRHRRAVERTVRLAEAVHRLGAEAVYATPEQVMQDIFPGRRFDPDRLVRERIKSTFS